jgi:hypothetical protein
MNWKKFFIAFIAAFIVMFVFGYLWWGMLMHGAHQEVPALWRPEAEFKSLFGWLILGHVALAFFFALVFVRGFGSGGGVGGGFRYGVLVGLLFASNDCITYAVQPLTTKILGGWIVGDVLMFAIAGLIVGALYKPSSTGA